jgi:RNA polymerase sigma factor (sigma-70 family)
VTHPTLCSRNSPEIDQLLAGCLAGNKNSWQQFVCEFDSSIEGTIHRFLQSLDSDSLKDVRQTVWIKVVKRLPSYDNTKSSLKTWICLQSSGCARDAWRAAQSRNQRNGNQLTESRGRTADFPSNGLWDRIPDPSAMAPDQILCRCEMRETLQEALDILGAPDSGLRRLLEWHYIQGLKCREIALATGLSIKTVTSGLVKGRRELRRIFESLQRRKPPQVPALDNRKTTPRTTRTSKQVRPVESGCGPQIPCPAAVWNETPAPPDSRHPLRKAA